MLVQCCPKCGRVLPGEDINDDTKISFCRVCNLSHDLKKLKRTPIHAPNADLGFPPSGTWYRDTGMEKTAGATCRSIPGAVVCGITALFWNVPVLALLVINAIATLGALGIRLPEWLPIQLRDAGSKMHVCMTGFIWLFMTPFVLIGLAMIDAFLSYL